VAVALDRARDQHARERLGGGELQVGIVLVVAQQDVVSRRPLLDQVVLERQRLHHRVGHDDRDARNLVEQRVGLRAGAVGAEIAADPISEAAGLADVDGIPCRVRVEIHPRLLRQPRNLFLESVNGHAAT
jgi:hypothetical protein